MFVAWKNGGVVKGEEKEREVASLLGVGTSTLEWLDTGHTDDVGNSQVSPSFKTAFDPFLGGLSCFV
jgi:hypothetical protein